MNEEVKETIKILQNNSLVKSGSYEFIGDSDITYAEIYILLKFIEDLQQETEKLKKQYCERTDCSGRIGNSKKVEELQNENQQLKKVIDKINHILNNQINYREFVDIVNAIEDVIKEVE